MDINQKYLELQFAIIRNGGVECETMPEFFFPEGPDHVKRYDETAAILICNLCPVKQLCADYAIAAKEPYGIFGGTKPEDRI